MDELFGYFVIFMFLCFITFVVALGLLISSSTAVFRFARKKEEFPTKYVVRAFIGLFLIDLLYYVYLSSKWYPFAGLKSELPLQFFLSFIVIVALPGTGFVLFKYTLSKKKFILFQAAVFLIIGISCISVTPGIKAAVVNERGEPVKGAYIFYREHGYSPLGEWKSFTFNQTDRHGRLAIPRRFFINFPFEYGFGFKKPVPGKFPVSIYAPGECNYCTIKDAYHWSVSKKSRGRLTLTFPTWEPVITLKNLCRNPESCFDSFAQLVFDTPFTTAEKSPDAIHKLLSTIKKNYDQWESQYGKQWDLLVENTDHGRTVRAEIRRLERQFLHLPEVEDEVEIKSQPLIPPGATGSHWTAWGANPGRSRCIPGQSILSPVLVKVSKINVGAREILFQDINRDGIPDLVICGLNDAGHYLFDVGVVDGNSQDMIWRFRCQARAFSFPMINKGALYFNAYFGEEMALYALELRTGRLLWKYRHPRFEFTGRYPYPVVDEEYVYFGTAPIEKLYESTQNLKGYLYAVDKTGGVLKWELAIKTLSPFYPLIMGNRLFYAGAKIAGKSFLGCVDLPARRLTWEFQTDHARFLSPPVIVGDLLICKPIEGVVYAVNIKDGKLKWKYKTSHVIFPDIAAHKDFTIFNSTGVYALDTETGEPKWQFASKKYFNVSPCIVGDMVYAGGKDGYLYAIRLQDGKKMWEYPFNGRIHSISAGGRALAVIVNAYQLYILRESPTQI